MRVQPSTVAGIDVGGSSKGFHFVILRGRDMLDRGVTTDAHALHRTCMAFDVEVVGIDAPCQWSVEGVEGAGRSAERELARERISCFATPTEARARENKSGFYEWMFNGARVYEAFAATHPVLRTAHYDGARAAIETFPHAITCALLRGREAVSAKNKRVQRRKLVAALGLDAPRLKSIDALDAALCALTAQWLVEGKTRAYGDAAGGFIFVPADGLLPA